MIKLKELIKEETKHVCECGGDCCKTAVNESLDLPKDMELGKVFTGQGKAFMKEEDSESVKEAKIFSDDWNLTKRVTSNFIKQNLKSVDNSIKKKDGEGLRFHLNQIIKGIQNAKRALKLESVNEAVEQETNIPFEMIGKSYISVKGRKLTTKLQFKGNDLQDVVNGKKKKGKVVLASITTK